MGVETESPVITEETESLNFTNEGGVNGTIRLLKIFVECGCWNAVVRHGERLRIRS